MKESRASLRELASAMQCTILPDATPHEGLINKAGILPFIIDSQNNIIFCVMKPKPARSDLKPPEFQICKGTRMLREGDEWRDIKKRDLIKYWNDDDLEPLLLTALREGEEEIGLRPENITHIYDAGPTAYISATTGVAKPMHLFLGHLSSQEHFDPLNSCSHAAAAREWFTIREYQMVGREDHIRCVTSALTRLQQYLTH